MPGDIAIDKAPSADRGQRADRSLELGRVAQQLATAQQITHIGSWEWDLASGALRWSDELYRIYGFEPQSVDVSVEFFISRLHPDDRERVHEHVRLALEQGRRFSYCERIVRPTGELRYLDTVGEALADASGKVVALIGTCRDVTEERERAQTLRLYADIAQNVQIGLSVWQLKQVEAETRLQLVAYNSATEGALGVSLVDCIGQDVDCVIPGLASTELPELMIGVAADGRRRELPTFRVVRPGVMRRTFSARVFALSDERVGLALEDVTQRMRAGELQAAEQRVLESLAAGHPLADVLEQLVLAIEKHVPHTLASILRVDSETSTVKVLAAPHLPPAYNAAIDGEPIGPVAGSCGTAAYLKQPVYSHDIASDPLWKKYRDVALGNGLRACWSTPILSSEGRVLGTFALYYREPRAPEVDELELIARATHVAGIVMERRQLDDRLRALSAHMEAVREDERTAMAREIHDELGQALTALKMDLAWIVRHVRTAPGAPPPSLDARMSGMSSMIDAIINQVRRIAAQLRPGVLDDLGLAAAVEWQTRDFSQRCGVECVVRSNVEDQRFERDLSTAIFRILQETLTNVARHAGASKIDVSLTESGERLVLVVQDDGRGLSSDVSSRPSSLGLLGMRERAHRLGGTFSVSSAPGSGTRVVVDVPSRRQGAS